MARISPIPPNRLIRIFQHLGFQVARQAGSHVSMTKKGVTRPLIIPMHSKPVPTFIILNNIKSAGISREEYLRVLSAL